MFGNPNSLLYNFMNKGEGIFLEKEEKSWEIFIDKFVSREFYVVFCGWKFLSTNTEL